jgi:1-acyl-sn-glycerol-3-phosphate acyltransferase
MTRTRIVRRTGAVLWSVLATWAAALVAGRLAPRVRRELSSYLAGQTLAALDVTVRVSGPLPDDVRPTLLVANHVPWLDVYALAALWPARFVAKAETRAWPVAGTIARRFDTVFLRRGSVRDAGRVRRQVAAALARGESVVVFPEGTTTDGTRLGRFHAAMFQAAIDAGAVVQPVALR